MIPAAETDENAALLALARLASTLPGAPLLHPRPHRGAGWDGFRHDNGLRQVQIRPRGAEIGPVEWVIDLSDDATAGKLVRFYLGQPWLEAYVPPAPDGSPRFGVGRPDRTGQVVAEFVGATLGEAAARAAVDLQGWPQGKSPLRERAVLSWARRCTQTYHRIPFDVMGPTPAMVDVRDIARALSQKGRFNGHTRRFYSVAEHACRVADLLRRLDYPVETQFWGLNHDDAEAYLPDVARPVKRLLGDLFATLEADVMGAIRDAIGLQGDQPSIVKWADNTLLATERDHLLQPMIPEIWEGLPEPMELRPGDVLGWSPERARAEFLERFYRLAEEQAVSLGLPAPARPAPPTVIAFTGRKGAGKDTAAAFLVEQLQEAGLHVERMAFAEPLKQAARDFFGWTHAHTDGTQTQKETVDATWGLSPRVAMQRLGTEVGRSLSPDLWIRHLRRRVQDSVADVVIVTDCRFRNEANALWDWGGHLIRLERPGADTADAHASEQEIDRLPVHFTVANDASLTELRDTVRAIGASLLRDPDRPELLIPAALPAQPAAEGTAA